MKMMHDLWRRASLNSLRTREAPTPAYISTKSEPLAEMNGTPASPAIERASSVLPVPGGPDEQDAARNAAADRREARRLLQEVDDLLHFVLGLVHAGDIAERDRDPFRIDGLQLLEGGHPAGNLMAEREEHEGAGDQQHDRDRRGVARRRRRLLDVEADAARDEPGDERGCGGDVPVRGDGLELGAVAAHEPEHLTSTLQRAHAVGRHVAEERRERHRGGRRAPRDEGATREGERDNRGGRDPNQAGTRRLASEHGPPLNAKRGPLEHRLRRSVGSNCDGTRRPPERVRRASAFDDLIGLAGGCKQMMRRDLCLIRTPGSTVLFGSPGGPGEHVGDNRS